VAIICRNIVNSPLPRDGHQSNKSALTIQSCPCNLCIVCKRLLIRYCLQVRPFQRGSPRMTFTAGRPPQNLPRDPKHKLAPKTKGRKKPPAVTSSQCDRIERKFAVWAHFISLGAFFSKIRPKSTQISSRFGLLFVLKNPKF
jgi:hypothetical protein